MEFCHEKFVIQGFFCKKSIICYQKNKLATRFTCFVKPYLQTIVVRQYKSDKFEADDHLSFNIHSELDSNEIV